MIEKDTRSRKPRASYSIIHHSSIMHHPSIMHLRSSSSFSYASFFWNDEFWYSHLSHYLQSEFSFALNLSWLSTLIFRSIPQKGAQNKPLSTSNRFWGMTVKHCRNINNKQGNISKQAHGTYSLLYRSTLPLYGSYTMIDLVIWIGSLFYDRSAPISTHRFNLFCLHFVSNSTEFPDSLSLSLSLSLSSSVPIIHCSWKVLETASSVRKELLYVNSCSWLTLTCPFVGVHKRTSLMSSFLFYL